VTAASAPMSRQVRRASARKTKAAAPAPPDPTTAYARDVVEGRILAGRLVVLACARHLRDLEHGHERGLVWRREKAQDAIDFFPAMLRLEDGRPFVLQPFQAFIVGAIFGWYGADGYRRFHTAYVEMGKGNGKSPLGAGIGLYMMVADGEPAPEIYSAATMIAQAKVVWKDAYRMVVKSPELAALIEHPDREEVAAGALTIPGDSAVFRPVSAEHRGLDGKRVHCGLCDELHEHAGPEVVDKMTAGMKNRLNGLIFEMTNSGYDRTTVCWQHHELSIAVLEETVVNDAWFAYVCTLDACASCAEAGKRTPQADCAACDDWKDSKVWLKTNPGLGTVLPVSYLERRVTDAKTMSSKENETKRFNFCVWTEQSERWLSLGQWDADACAAPLAELDGRRLFIGVDMQSPRDLCCAALVWEPDGAGVVDVELRAWLPRAALEPEPGANPSERQALLRRWAEDEVVTLTDGNAWDAALVREQLLAVAAEHELGAFALNQAPLGELSKGLLSALDKEQVTNRTYSFPAVTAACKDLEARVAGGKLRHAGNPVLRWTVPQVSIAHGSDQMIRVDREGSVEKVAVAALVAALAVMAQAPPRTESEGSYKAEWV